MLQKALILTAFAVVALYLDPFLEVGSYAADPPSQRMQTTSGPDTDASWIFDVLGLAVR